MNTIDPTASMGLAQDAKSLDALKTQASKDPKSAIRQVARQFEALFMQELMKSMRKATLESGLTDNEGSRMGTEMLDSQWAQQLSGIPGGLASAIERQLNQRLQGTSVHAASERADEGKLGVSKSFQRRNDLTVPRASPDAGERAVWRQKLAAIGDHSATPSHAQFIQTHWAAAKQVEQRTGIPAAFMVAQAGLESGWGRGEIKHSDGRSAHNLFGIKAGGRWQGDVANVMTTEFIQGASRKIRDNFRAYANYAESFADYAQLIAGNGRYRGAMSQLHSPEGYAKALQQGGYATDPQYAEKLGQVIRMTQRVASLLR